MRLFQRRLCLGLGLTAGLMALSHVCGSKAWADIHVDSAQKFQTMNGWEVTLSGLEIDPVSDKYDPAWVTQGPDMLKRMVNDVGINRVRIGLASGAENTSDYFPGFASGQLTYDQMKAHFYEKINDNDDPNVADLDRFHFGEADFRVEHELLPIKQAVEANGEKLYVSVCYVDFRWTPLQGSLHHGSNAEEYAELVLVFFNHLRDKYGITPDALEIILEPENTNDWNGTGIGRAAVAAARRLQAAGYKPDIIAPSTTSAGNAVPYFNDAIAVPGASSVISMLSYHRYSSGDYAGIRQAAAAHGMKTGMLEYVPGTADDLLEDLTVGNVSAWQKYGVVSPDLGNDYGYLYADVSNHSAPKVKFGAATALLWPFFKFVRSGAVRVAATSTSDGFRPVAFVNANGSYVVVIKSNDGGTVSLSGLGNGTYGISSGTSDGKVINGSDLVATNGALSITIPGGVTALYGKVAGSVMMPPAGPPDAGAAVVPPGGSPDPMSRSDSGAGGPMSGSPEAVRDASLGAGAGLAARDGGGAGGSGAGSGSDGGIGGGSVAASSDAAVPGGSAETISSSCGCRVAGARSASPVGWLAVLAPALLLCKRSRRKASHA
ncbi:MAG: hypothetical protein JWN48_3413 [Myxococcaceae bacterium]|nr:hypothetical protein [Myxococcaceae bacterium]